LTAAKTLLGAGSASAPSLTAIGDTNTGVFFPTADTIAFAEGGAEAMRIDSSGRVGIGSTSPGTKLHIEESSTDCKLRIISGTASDAVIQLGDTASATQGAIIYDNGADALRFQANGSERARIDSSGRLLVGTTTTTANGGVLELSGGITFPATAVAASNANTLDDYEEGTWTPSLGGTATYSVQTGRYTKIGQIVTVHFIIQVNTIGTGSVTQVSGLPFACVQNGAGSCDFFDTLVTSLVHITPFASTTAPNTSVKFRTLTAAADAMGTANIFKNSTRVDGTITYIA